jgi:DNA-binding transcriptional MerR regulator
LNPAEAMAEFNYFNYFTEIEEYFWKKRGAHLLVSPLDWAILETWQKAGIPLPAVLKGIDRAFESYARSRRAAGGRQLKSLAYCVDAVLDAAEEEKETSAGAGPAVARKRDATESFSREELRSFFHRNGERISAASGAVRATQPELASRIHETGLRLAEISQLLDTPAALDLEDVERRLTVVEEKLTASLTANAPEEFLVEARREMDRQLAPCRRKMTSAQLSQLERQYMQKRLWERYNLPRLSLFYLT